MKLVCKQCGVAFERKRKRSFCGYPCSNKHNADRAIDRMKQNKKHIVWSCGGGVDSTAIALFICKGIIPKPDYAVMFDSGYERQSTWDFVKNELLPRLKEVGVNLEIIKSVDYGADTNLINKQGYINIPAYRKIKDSIQKLHTRCFGPWKAKVSLRWLRSKGIKYSQSIIGISNSESKRMKVSSVAWNELSYPLVELGITREKCLYLLGQAGWPMPNRTSCFMCPNQTNAEWLWLKNNEPNEFERAIRVEKQLQKHDSNIFLHRTCQSLDYVNFTGEGT